jgi:deoxycytidylate deaminase
VLVNTGVQRFVYAEPYREHEHQARIQTAASETGVEMLSLT